MKNRYFWLAIAILLVLCAELKGLPVPGDQTSKHRLIPRFDEDMFEMDSFSSQSRPLPRIRTGDMYEKSKRPSSMSVSPVAVVEGKRMKSESPRFEKFFGTPPASPSPMKSQVNQFLADDKQAASSGLKSILSNLQQTSATPHSLKGLRYHMAPYPSSFAASAAGNPRLERVSPISADSIPANSPKVNTVNPLQRIKELSGRVMREETESTHQLERSEGSDNGETNNDSMMDETLVAPDRQGSVSNSGSHQMVTEPEVSSGSKTLKLDGEVFSETEKEVPFYGTHWEDLEDMSDTRNLVDVSLDPNYETPSLPDENENNPFSEHDMIHPALIASHDGMDHADYDIVEHHEADEPNYDADDVSSPVKSSSLVRNLAQAARGGVNFSKGYFKSAKKHLTNLATTSLSHSGPRDDSASESFVGPELWRSVNSYHRPEN